MFLKTKKAKYIAFVLVAFLVTPSVSFAWFHLDVFNYILTAALEIESGLLAYIATYTDYMIQPQPIIDAPMVQKGWTITRDFANMFFIIILLAIALSFILFPRFQIKRSLPILLVVALLINFSLPIAGVFLDFANVITNFFLTEITKSGASVSEIIANNLNIQNIYNIELADAVKQDLKKNLDAEIFKTSLFAIFYMLVLIFIYLALFVMFLIRNIYLYVLLILLPLALVVYILPAGRKYFSQWSGKFIQWTFFAPLAAFFIYLSLLSLKQVTITQKEALSQGLEGNIIPNISDIYNYIVVIALLMMSLFAANSLGIKTAGTSINLIKKGSRTIAGGVGRGGKTLAGMAARQAKIPEAMGGLAKATKFVPAWMGGAYATRKLTGGAATIRAGKAKRAELTEPERKMAEKMSDVELETTMKAGGPMAHEYAAILARRGKLKEAYVGEMYKKAKKFNSEDAMKAIIKAAPHEIEKIKEEEINKMQEEELFKEYKTRDKAKAKTIASKKIWGSIKPSDIEKLPEEYFEGSKGEQYLEKMLENEALTAEHLKAAARSGNKEIIKAFRELRKRGVVAMLSLKMDNWAESDAAKGLGI